MNDRKAHLNAIKAHYRAVMPLLLESSDEWGIDPYAWDSEVGIVLTPIEQALWADIRAADLVMYPQFPVAGYFVDFGNPAAKVAIECDGERWHTDKERDSQRQRAIEYQGWSVYRISGSDCFRPGLETQDEAGRTIVARSKAREFIDNIAWGHRVSRQRAMSRAPAAPLSDALVRAIDSLVGSA